MKQLAGRVVLDTNVLVSAAKNRATHAGAIVEKIIQKEVVHITSVEILEEFEKVLSYNKLGISHAMRQEFYNTVVAVSRIVKPRYVMICRDPDDDKFISCALHAQATLITGDKDLISLREQLKISTIREFVES